MSISANAQITLINMSEAYTVLLTNESQQFPTNSSRVPLSNVSYYTDIVVYQGSTERTDYTIGTVSSSNNITVSQTASRVTFTVSTSSTISADSGTFTIPITIDGQTFNKIFSWSCAKQGTTGTSAKSVNIVASSQVFKSIDGGSTFSPDTITLTPVFQGGISYSKWQYSTNGSTWTNVTSGSHGLTIASGVLTIAKSSNLYSDTVTSVSFKCISSTSTYYDIITVVKLYDVTNLVPQIEEIRTSISNVELKVDQNTKIISQKASQTDIANAINEYDNSTVETIRDTVAEHTTSIGNITSKVSEVESTVTKKANSSTVQTLSTKVSTLEQDAASFKTTVSETYTTKEEFNDLEIGGRNIATGTSSEWKSGVVEDGINKCFVPFYLKDFDKKGLQVGDIIQVSVDLKFSDDFAGTASGTPIAWLQGNMNYDETTWVSLPGISPDSAKADIKAIIDNSTKEGHINAYFTVTSHMIDGTYSGYLHLSIRFDYYSGTVYWRHQKVEKGNKATDWTPAPEDVDEEIYSTINTIEATAQSLRSEIINTKEELQSSFEQTSKEINIRVENTETSLQTVINESIPKINKEVDEATSQLQVQIDNISGTVAVVQDNITTMSKTIQDANGWKLLFATLGMYDGDDIGEKPNNVIWMNKEGIRVSNRDPSDQTSKKAGNTTLITDQEFSGYVNDGSVTGDGTKMFEFNKEHVYTNRLKADNGIDLITLKIIPAKYGTVNALNFISGSGNS